MTSPAQPLRFAVLLLIGCLCAPALAQSTTPPASTPAAASPVEAPAPPPGCFPACREGYVCYFNQCISACNPPCARDERCTANGQCERELAPPPPPPPPPPPLPTTPATERDASAEPPEKPGYRRHDGFMLRLAAGAGGGGLHLDGDNDWGGAGFFSFDIGGSPVENFVLHFRMSHYAFSPENGPRMLDHVGVGIWGVGATWYVMPVNVYVTASLGFAGISFNEGDDSNDDMDLEGGFGTGLDVGKEWWVGGSWGLGIAGRLNYVVVDTYASTGLAILFSATYQ